MSGTAMRNAVSPLFPGVTALITRIGLAGQACAQLFAVDRMIRAADNTLRIWKVSIDVLLHHARTVAAMASAGNFGTPVGRLKSFIRQEPCLYLCLKIANRERLRRPLLSSWTGNLSFIGFNHMATYQKKSYTQEVGSLGAHLRAPADAMVRFCYSRLAERGFSDVRAAHGVLFRHISREGSRVTDMAAAAQMSKQSMAEIVEYLRQRGYVALSKDPTDRRANLVCMTERGWKVQRALIQTSAEFERQCVRTLGDKRWPEFRAVLRDMATRWPGQEPVADSRRTVEMSEA